MSSPILIAGAGGMLGTALRAVCARRGVETVVPEESTFDITSVAAVRDVVASFARSHPGAVLVNAAAYTNVERAEDDSERAFRVNEFGAALLAEAAAREGLRFVHVSTDFVFDGKKAGAYTEADEPNPLSVYGASKLAGELAVAAVDPHALIARTAWVFGPGGANFPTKILGRAAQSTTIQVVCDEVGSPTYTIDLAEGVLRLADLGAEGLFHLVGAGWCARDEMAREVLRLAGRGDVEVEPVPASTFPSKAARPANSVLDCAKAAALGVLMPDWRDSLARFVVTLP
jgi:dTDP-4-dehydrorhamnose reductase